MNRNDLGTIWSILHHLRDTANDPFLRHVIELTMLVATDQRTNNEHDDDADTD